MSAFLARNGIELSYTQEELSDVVVNVADGDSSFEDMLQVQRMLLVLGMKKVQRIGVPRGIHKI